MTTVAIICRACGQQGDAAIERLATDMVCSCGSDDLDLDMEVEAAVERYESGPCPHCGGEVERTAVGGEHPLTGVDRFKCKECHSTFSGPPKPKQASWESDIPMNTLRDTQTVTQTARCAFCFNEWQVTVTDPAQPLPACPNCGSTATSAAGATMTYATGSLQAEGLSEGGILSTIINMVNFARSSGDDEIPGWFMKFFKGMLLPEEIASGHWVSGGGGSYGWGTMGAKTAAGVVCVYCKNPISYDELDWDGHWKDTTGSNRCPVTGGKHIPIGTGADYPDKSAEDIEYLNDYRRAMGANTTPDDKPDDHPGYICPAWDTGCNYHSRSVDDMEMHMKEKPEHRRSAAYKGPPKMPKKPISPGAGQGEDPEAERLKYERQQKRIEQERQWNTEGDEKARKLIPSHFKSGLDPGTAKVLEITDGIQANNPAIARREAAKLAEEVVSRYPKMVRRSG